MDIQNTLTTTTSPFRSAPFVQGEASATAETAQENRNAAIEQTSVTMSQMTEKLKGQLEQPERVAQIKAQLAEGSFEINPEKIAGALIEEMQLSLLASR